MMSQNFALSLLVLLYAVGFCQGAMCKLVFKDCGSKQGALVSAMYNGTCSQGHAMLKRGTVASIDFKFHADVTEATLKSKVAGKIGELPFVPFPLSNPDACKNSGLTCPVAANVDVDYSPSLSVLKAYPLLNVIVRWELQDANGADVFCALIPATIVD